MDHMENSGTIEREWQICEAQEVGIIPGYVGAGYHNTHSG